MVYAWVRDFAPIGAGLLFLFGLLTVTGDVVEYIFGIAGAFLGALLIELLTCGFVEWRKAVRSGWGNLMGRISGVISKMAIAIGMIVWIAATVLT